MRHANQLTVMLGVSALVLGAALAPPAEAQHRLGGGGLHVGGGAGGLRPHSPTNFHAPGSGGGGIKNPRVPADHPGGGGGSGPPPGPGPGPNPGPGPGPGPHPDPGPGPGPGPGSHPGPPPPPPPPPSGWGYGWGWDDDPLWDAAAIGIVAGTTAAVVASASTPSTVIINTTSVGSVVTALPPNCPKVVRGSMTYFSCNQIWYLPQYQSSGVTYVIVNPPG